MQRCGIKVKVLEARHQVGGRVRSSQVADFSVPVDMGASIITGTQVDVAKGLRPDPSAVIARCCICWLQCSCLQLQLAACQCVIQYMQPECMMLGVFIAHMVLLQVCHAEVQPE